jgi:HSP20 family protein
MVDITEDENEIVLWVDLPGVSQKEVDIIINGDQLTLKGEKKFDQTNQRKYLRRERLVGPFSRTFQLNLPVETEEISAAYRNGVLEIHLPKPAESKPRKVSIQTE